MQGKEETEGSTGGRVRQACAQTLREAQRCAQHLASVRIIPSRLTQVQHSACQHGSETATWSYWYKRTSRLAYTLLLLLLLVTKSCPTLLRPYGL